MDRPNVVLIVLDTARARSVLDRRSVMPHLHRVADTGTTFTNAYATAPWTLPSHASLFTGTYTSDHGSHAGSTSFEPETPVLAELLRSHGYRTAAFSNNTWISADFGFDRGFDEFVTGWELFEDDVDLATIAKNCDTVRERTAAVGRNLARPGGYRTLANALYTRFLRKRYDDGAFVTNWRIKRWLSRREDEDRPFFLFVNYLEPHLEYDPPKRFRDRFVPEDLDASFVESVNQDAWAYITGQVKMDADDFRALRALYDAELNYLDHRLGQLFDFLDDRGLLDETALFVVGDHGENLGEHGLMDHQYCLYDTLLHVPLIARLPNRRSSAETSALVEIRDLYPTILELAGIDRSQDGRVSTNSLLRSNPDREYVLAEYRTPQPSMDALERRVGDLSPETYRYDRGLRSVRTTGWKCIEGTDGSFELYDLADDSGERTNLADAHPDRCAKFSDMMTAELGPLERVHDGSTDALDPTTRRRLEKLGYVR